MTKERKKIDKSIPLKDNALLKHFPEYFDTWNFERNDKKGVNIYEITFRSGKKVWWKCDKGHEYERVVSNETRQKSGCPFCKGIGNRANINFQVGANDMWTTNPEMAKLLLHKEDGYTHSYASTKVLSWICPDCKNITKSSSAQVHFSGYRCLECSDGLSQGEKFIYNLLKSIKVDFDFNSSFKWSKGRQYDFYIPVHNMIIEVHGEQHYKGRYSTIGGRSVEEEEENDKLKRQLAEKNNIKVYIELDFEKSDFDYMVKSIEDSSLKGILREEFDYDNVLLKSRESLVKVACDLWNEGKTTYEIAKEVKVVTCTVKRYLKRGKRFNWCSYSREEDARRRGQIPTKNGRHEVVQLTKDGDFIAYWNSIKEASKHTGASTSGTSSCCLGRLKSARGFKWMYRVLYDKKQRDSEE